MSFTKLLFALLLLAAVLVFAIPSIWPEPSVEAVTAPTAAAGEDMTFTLRVTTWHENFRLRLVRLTMNDVASTAARGKGPLLPLTLLRDDMAHEWNIGIFKRVTFPRVLSLELLLPFKELYQKGRIGTGLFKGNVLVEIDHTKAQLDGKYPNLIFRANLPFEVTITD